MSTSPTSPIPPHPTNIYRIISPNQPPSLGRSCFRRINRNPLVRGRMDTSRHKRSSRPHNCHRIGEHLPRPRSLPSRRIHGLRSQVYHGPCHGLGGAETDSGLATFCCGGIFGPTGQKGQRTSAEDEEVLGACYRGKAEIYGWGREGRREAG